jgi:hypothetical protein
MQDKPLQWHVERSSSRKVNSITEENNEDVTAKVDELICTTKGNPKPNLVTDLKIMRSSADDDMPQELDYRNTPALEEDLVRMITLKNPGTEAGNEATQHFINQVAI